MNFCISCGSQLEDSAKFCANCGHQVGTPIQPNDSQNTVVSETPISEPSDNKQPAKKKSIQFKIITVIGIILLAFGIWHYLTPNPHAGIYRSEYDDGVVEITENGQFNFTVYDGTSNNSSITIAAPLVKSDSTIVPESDSFNLNGSESEFILTMNLALVYDELNIPSNFQISSLDDFRRLLNQYGSYMVSDSELAEMDQILQLAAEYIEINNNQLIASFSAKQLEEVRTTIYNDPELIAMGLDEIIDGNVIAEVINQLSSANIVIYDNDENETMLEMYDSDEMFLLDFTKVN